MNRLIRIDGTAMDDGTIALECNECGPFAIVEGNEHRDANAQARKEGRSHMQSHGVPDSEINVHDGRLP